MADQPDSSAVGAILTALGTMPQDVAVIKTDIGYLKRQSETNATNIGEALRTLAAVTSDAAASAAGRDLLRRLKEVEDQSDKHEHEAELRDARLDSLEDFRTEVKGGMKLLRAEATFATVIAAFVSTLWVLHLLGIVG